MAHDAILYMHQDHCSIFVINWYKFTKYVVILILIVIVITAITLLALQNTMQVNAAVQGVGPLYNASITYMEFA